MDKTPLTINALTFEFLWWFKLTAFFPGDMMIELKELGASDELAYMISRSESVRAADVVKFAHDWVDDVTVVRYIERYIQRWENQV